MIELLLAAVLAASPAPPQAQKAANTNDDDLRCLTASILLVGSSKGDAKLESAGTLLSFYYLGRLEGRDPTQDWITRSIELGESEGSAVLTELARCGAEFEAKGAEMAEKGRAAGG